MRWNSVNGPQNVVPSELSSKTSQSSVIKPPSRTNLSEKYPQKKNRRLNTYYKNRICYRCTRIHLYLLPLAFVLFGGAIAAIILASIKTPPLTLPSSTTTMTNISVTTITASTLTIITTTSVTIITTTSVTTTKTASTVVSTTTTTMSVTTTTTTTTTTVTCVASYVRTPSQTCVNTMIDFYNCGTVGRVCSSNYTSCSAGVCSTAPGIQLVNPNNIWSSATNGVIDDSMYNVSLPFNITLYNTTKDHITVTSNGVLCLGNCAIAYAETALPTTAFSGVTVLAYWDDLYVYPSTSQGIYYGTEGNIPNRTLIFEYYLSHHGQPTQYYHFQVLFFETAPNIVQIKYFEASDGGASCTVGVQASSSGPSTQYSFHQANSVQRNMTLTFDTILGAYTSSVIG